ncbi:MAG: ABC transporter permease, partial [Myxococcota bacterium]|nr:ABC transporter permease [Myxococcota bacterium]
MIGTTAGLAFSALLRNKLRSMLTMLGIVIGVAAVVMMQSVGRGATAYVGEAISGLGSNMLIVMPGQAKGIQQNTLGAPLFTAGDLDAVRHQARDVGLVTAAGSRVLRVVFGSNNRSVNSGGVMPEYFEIRGWGVSSGRLPTQEDERGGAAVCVVGQTVSDALFERRDPVGKDLRVRDMTCRVIGVLESKGASAFGIDQDDVVFLPYTTFARRILGNDRIGILMATAVSKDRIDEAKEEISVILRKRRHSLPGDEDNFAVRDPRELQSLLESVT